MWSGTLIKLLRQRAQRLDGLSLQSLWLIACSVSGSIGIIPGLFGFYFFRGMNRVSIIILALALFAFVRWASRATRNSAAASARRIRRADPLSRSLGSTPIYGKAEARAYAERMENDRRFIEHIETKLPDGAMIFQLPVTRSQEAEPVRAMHMYDQFRPYIVSRTLHFSHGDDFGRAPERWRELVSALPVPGMVKQLERHGFSGIMIDRDALPNRGADLAGLIRRGRKTTWDRQPARHIRFYPPRSCDRAGHTEPAYHLCPRLVSPEHNAVDVWRWTERDASIEVYTLPKVWTAEACFAGDAPSKAQLVQQEAYLQRLATREYVEV